MLYRLCWQFRSRLASCQQIRGISASSWFCYKKVRCSAH